MFPSSRGKLVGLTAEPMIGSSLSAFGSALAKREISRIMNAPKPGGRVLYNGTVDEQVSSLETTINLMKEVELHPTLARYGKATLWHTDLHMGNIFVSDKDPSQILSIIDWKSTLVSPLFLQAHWPVFLNPPKNYTTGLVHPKLPDNFDQLESVDKELAKYEWKQATRTKAYEVSNYLNDKDAHHAMNVPRVFRELFVRCGDTWEEGCVPLRACLIEIFQTWQALRLSGDCPFTFTEDVIQAHELEFEKYQDWHSVQEFAKEYLDTDLEAGFHRQQTLLRSLSRTRPFSSCFLIEWLERSLTKRYGRCGLS